MTGADTPATSLPMDLPASGFRTSASGMVLGSAILSGSIVCMLLMIGVTPGIADLATLCLGCAIVVAAGETLLSLSGCGAFPGRIAVAPICGFVATALAQLLGVFVANVDAGSAFAAWSVIVVLAAAWVLPRSQGGTSAGDALDAAVIIGISAMSLFAMHDKMAVVSMIANDGRLLFTDGVLHATVLAQFGDPLSLHRGSAVLVDTPLPLSHYGYYMPTAAIMRLLDLPPLAADGGLLVPLSVIFGGMGVYALGASLGGRLAGALSIGLLYAFPDGAHFGLQHRYFGFHWFTQFEAGSGYGIGVSMAVLGVLDQFRRSRRPKTLALSLGMAVALFQIRAQLFLILIPTLAIILLYDAWVMHGRIRRPLAFLAAVFLAACVAALLYPPAREAIGSFSNAPVFFGMVLGMDSILPGQIFGSMAANYGLAAALAAGVILVCVAVLGILLPGYIVALIASRIRRGPTRFDCLPLAMLFVYAGIMLLAPLAPFADPNTEFQHRPMVLVYATFATLLATLAIRAVGLDNERASAARYVLPTILAVMIVSIGVQATGIYKAELIPRHMVDFFRVPTSRDIVPIALRIRADSSPGDTLAVAGVGHEGGNTDRCVELASVSGVPCFLGRPWDGVNGSQEAIVRARLAILDSIDNASDSDAVRRILRKNGISWYFVPADLRPAWASGNLAPVMTTAEGKLYRVAR